MKQLRKPMIEEPVEENLRLSYGDAGMLTNIPPEMAGLLHQLAMRHAVDKRDAHPGNSPPRFRD